MNHPAYSADQANHFLQANFAPWILDLNPLVISVSEAETVLEMPPNDRLHRAGNIVCGQALMAIADTAMVIGLVSVLHESNPLTTVDMTTSFMRPIADDTLVATSSIVRLGRTMAFMRVDMTAKSSGKAISHASGTYAILSSG